MSGIPWTATSRVLLVTECPGDATDLARMIEAVGFDVTIAVPRGDAVPPGLPVAADFVVLDVRRPCAFGKDTPALLHSGALEVPVAVISFTSIHTAIHTRAPVSHDGQGTLSIRSLDACSRHRGARPATAVPR